MSGSDPSQRDPEEYDLDLDLDLDFGGGLSEDAAQSESEPPQAGTSQPDEVQPGEVQPGESLDMDFAPTQPAPSADGVDLYGGDLDTLDLSAEGGTSEEQFSEGPTADHDAGAFVADESQTSFTAHDGADLDPEGLDIDGLEVSAEAPEGTYDRPEADFEIETTAHEPAFEENTSGLGDELGIDFDAPHKKSNLGVVAAAGVAGAIATVILAVVNPAGPDPELVLPPLASSAAPTVAPAIESAHTSVVPGLDEPGPVRDLLIPFTSELLRSSDLFAELESMSSIDDVPSESLDVAEAAGEGLEPSLNPVLELAQVLSEAESDESSGELAVGPEFVGEPEPVAAPQEELRASRTAEMNVLDQVLLPEDRTGIAFVDPEEMTDLWLGEELPPKGLHGRFHRLTPRVGPVRLVTNLGEVFQGELYSIGDGEVSISNHLGRMTFSSRQITEVVRMTTVEDAAPAAVSVDSERVRVRVPGGWVYGRLLNRDQGRVTLLTDSGGRVTLNSTEIMPLGANAATAFPAESQEGVERVMREALEADDESEASAQG